MNKTLKLVADDFNVLLENQDLTQEKFYALVSIEVTKMSNSVIGKNCKLKRATRVTDGSVHGSEEQWLIKSVKETLGKTMYLVSLPDGISTFLFPDEIEILD